MARKVHEDALGVAGAETVIGTGVNVKGNLSSQSDIIVDGHVAGNIHAEGNVTIGVNAQVSGEITGANVTVGGEHRGNITASGETTLLATGQVHGNIATGGLAVNSGAIFIGQCKMEAPESLRQPPASPETAN